MPESCIRVRTEPDSTGVYRAVLEMNEDTVHPLDANTAILHAQAVIEAAMRAEYDAAVLQQMMEIGKNTKKARAAAITLLASLRANRAPIRWPTPLTLIPGASLDSGKAFLRITINGIAVGQWTTEDARSHASGVLEALSVAILDSGYLQELRNIGIDEPRAMSVVMDLITYRP